MPDIKAPALSPALLQLAEHPRNLWHVTVPPGIPIGSLSNPEFWAHCTKLRAYDKIECRAQDNAWYAELVVAKVTKNAASVWVVLYADLRPQPANAETAADYKVEFGGAHKWRVIRLHDKEVVHKGEPDEGAAQAWLDAHLKTVEA